MMVFDLLSYPPHVMSSLEDALFSTLHSGFWSTGPQVSKLEETLSCLYSSHCVATSSGGSSLQLIQQLYPSIKRIGIQSNTYFASALPWVNAGCEIVLLASAINILMPDISIVADSCNLNLDALLITHIGGYPNPHIYKIAELCRKHNIILIEDCAHAPLVSLGGQYVGTFGDAAILSFFPTKPIPAGEGGILILRNKCLSDEAKRIRNYGKTSVNGSIIHSLPAATNFRMNEFTAAIVNTLVHYYDDVLELRYTISTLYDEFFQEKSFIRNYDEPSAVLPSYYKYIVFNTRSDICTSPVYDHDNQLSTILRNNNVNFGLVGRENYFQEHTCLPIAPGMSTIDVSKVISSSSVLL